MGRRLVLIPNEAGAPHAWENSFEFPLFCCTAEQCLGVGVAMSNLPVACARLCERRCAVGAQLKTLCFIMKIVWCSKDVVIGKRRVCACLLSAFCVPILVLLLPIANALYSLRVVFSASSRLHVCKMLVRVGFTRS